MIGGLLPLTASASSPWLPFAGQWDSSISATFEEADDFWRGTESRALPAGKAEQFSTHLVLGYGLTDALALDLRVGYTGTKYGGQTIEGLDDTEIGLRYALLNEDAFDAPSWLPSAAIRIAGVLEGTYEINQSASPVSPGNGASGGDIGLIVGKRFHAIGAGAVAGINHRWRNEDVSSAWSYHAGIYKTLPGNLTVSVSVSGLSATNGPDIGEGRAIPPFLSIVAEEWQIGEVGLHWQPNESGPSVSLSAAQSIDGRNTTDRSILRFGVGWKF